jgi:hypothetical protein
MNERDLRQYLGHPLQVAGIRHFEFKSGKAKGVEGYELDTGGGLRCTVLRDRCLDLGWASYRGVNFAYLGSPAVVAPAYFQPQGLGWLESFGAGLLTTCGLASAGAPSVDQGQELGLHGRIGHVPAEEGGFETLEGEAGITGWRIHGRMRETRVFGEHLLLVREITAGYGGRSLRIRDRAQNLGFAEQPFQLLYHCNFGYPLLSERAELVLPSRSVTPRNPRAAEGLDQHLRVEPPQAGYEEQCFYHDLKTDADGYAHAALLNPELGFGVYQRFRKDALPRFVQWKQMGQGTYVMGLEPGNCLPDGRALEREQGRLRFLAPGEVAEQELEIGILDGAEEMARFRERMLRCR